MTARQAYHKARYEAKRDPNTPRRHSKLGPITESQATFSRSADEDRDRWLQYQYGIDSEGYEELLAAQGGVCAICAAGPTTKRLSVDHCHETGVIRGLLCAKCNRGLGSLGDTAACVRRALAYLEGADAGVSL